MRLDDRQLAILLDSVERFRVAMQVRKIRAEAGAAPDDVDVWTAIKNMIYDAQIAIEDIDERGQVVAQRWPRV
jgi:hypothetical protein